MYSAINVGLRLFKTDWLAYINSDDWIYPNSLKRLLHKAVTTKADFMYGNCDFSDASGRFMHTLTPAKSCHLLSIIKAGGMGFTQQATIFRRECYEKLNGFDENFRFCGDKDFFVRAMLAGFKFVYLSNPPIACFRLHSDQLSQVKSFEMALEEKLIKENYLGNPSLVDHAIVLKWKAFNIPQYILRFIRQSTMANKFVATRSISSGLHGE
jgi:GT2 family glycosyltransferase